MTIKTATINNLGAKGSFTLPGEAGYEELTLELAERWGADAIRDSDGTVLSDEIVAAGFSIYSTICLVRIDNEWAKANPDKLQQNFLMSYPIIAEGDTLSIDPLNGYFMEQFKINANDDPKAWWQGASSPSTIRRDGTSTQSTFWPTVSGRPSRCTTISPTTGGIANT